MLTPLLKPVFLFMSLILPIWILYRLLTVAYQKRNGNSVCIKNELILILFVIYVSTVLAITIAPASISGFNEVRAPGINIVPLINSYKYFITTLSEPDHISTGFALENIIGNFILFIPLGVFLPCIFRKFNSIKNVTAICFLSSLSIELTQLILRQSGTYRTVDIDDIILNTAGGLLGWLIFYKLTGRHFIKNAPPQS